MYLLKTVAFSITLALSALSLVAAPRATPAPAGGLYIIVFEEAPLATYGGGISGLEATAPRARGEKRLDAKSAASVAYLDFLDQRQAQYLTRLGDTLERTVEPVFRYRAVTNAVAAKLSAAESVRVAKTPGVMHVIADRVATLDTDRGPIWIGAPAIWDGTATPSLVGTQGEGIVIGVLDTGVNMDHPSFAATGGDGYTHSNPNGNGIFVGWCDPGHPSFDPSYVCNDKLIGAWDFTDAYCAANPEICDEADGPEDNNGHGSHTASIAAGNVLLSPAITGVAPHANIIAYDVCYPSLFGTALCPLSVTSAGVDQATLDGVDVTNFSISGGSDPWSIQDIDSFFLGAFAAGVFPAASAGNDGSVGSVGHRGPWMTSVASSTHDRGTIENRLVDMTGGLSPPADIVGSSRTDGYGPAPIVYAGNFSNGDVDPEQCLSPFPPGTWTDQIVLCNRGTIGRVVKCANVAAGGAAGCVLANVTADQSAPEPDPHVIPAVHIGLADGSTVRAWLATGSGHMASIDGATISSIPAAADIMASTSSKGPALGFNTLKPDLTNPGVAIFAAYHTDGALPPPEFAELSGTSMSSPHTAGSAALLASVHPDWSPAEIKSALMLTADTSVRKSGSSTPADVFDMGAGRVDLNRAALTGLVLDASAASYLAANPATGGDPSTLNVPSLQQENCAVSCTFTRTVTSTQVGEGAAVPWEITTTTPAGLTLIASPGNFVLPAGGSQEITFTADVGGQPFGTWLHAEIQLQEAVDGLGPPLHMPVAISPSLENLPERVRIETEEATGSHVLDDLRSSLPITDLQTRVSGVMKATETEFRLGEDPTNDDPYDSFADVFVRFVEVPEGSKLLRVIAESEESPDIDLFVGEGGLPSAADLRCSSATPAASEQCDINAPSGLYWIVVQNWSGSAMQPDLIKLSDVFIPDTDLGNLEVLGPSTVAAGMGFELELAWNDPQMANGGLWLGTVEVGTDSDNPDNLGSILVTIENLKDHLFIDGFESGDTQAWSATTSP